MTNDNLTNTPTLNLKGYREQPDQDFLTFMQ